MDTLERAIPRLRVKPRCDALTSTYSTDAYNANRLRCNQWIGLQEYTDRDGNKRHWCAAPGHARDVMRRYPRRLPEVCSFCGRPTDELSLPVGFPDGHLGALCFRCQDDREPVSNRDNER